jgi:hypothetical protein
MICEGNFLPAPAARRAKALCSVLAFLLLAAAGSASPVKACQAPPFSFSQLLTADVIVRATAVKYVVVPPEPNLVVLGPPDSTVEFKVEETLKGTGLTESLVLNAQLSDKDDYNEKPVPYKIVRPDGQRGSCYANTYKQGAQFLLFLKKTGVGYASDFVPLGPTNEQLKSETDPWLLWVKVRLNPCGKLYEHDEFYEKVQEGKLFETAKWEGPPNIKYRLAKCYLQKYGDQDDQYVTYIKKWVGKYERDEEQR